MAGLAEKEENFKNWKIPELKKYLQARGICLQQKKEDLVELMEKAHELALELTDDNESVSDVVNMKLVTKDGSIPNPFNLHSDWSTDFADALKVFEHIRVCLVTFRLPSRHAAIHLRCLSCSLIPGAYCFFSSFDRKQ